MSEVLTLSAAEVLKLFERKVNEALTLLENIDLQDNQRQEVLKYWQQVTARFHNQLRKIPVNTNSNHGDNVYQTKQVDCLSSKTGSRRGRRKSNQGKSLDNIGTEKIISQSDVDHLSLIHPSPPHPILHPSSSQTISMVTPHHLNSDLHLDLDSTLNINNNLTSQDTNFVHNYSSNLSSSNAHDLHGNTITQNTEILKKSEFTSSSVVANSQYSANVSKYINIDSGENVPEPLAVLTGSSYHDDTNQDVTCSQPLIEESRMITSGFEGVPCSISMTSVSSENESRGQQNKETEHELETRVEDGIKHGKVDSEELTKPTPGVNKRYPQRIRVSARLKTLYEYTDTNSDDDKAEEEDGEEDEDEDDRGDAKKGNKENVKKKKKKKKDDEDVTCHVCGIKLIRTSSLIVHMRQHTGVRPFRCSVCDRTFTTKANMQRHEDSIHKGLKPFKCTVCPRSFGEKKTLTSHMTTHSGERPYRCPICDQGFAQRGTMKHHMYRHTNHKGHLCDLCGKSFRQKTNLLVHQRRHVNQRKFSCDVCEKSFFTKGDLSRHNSRHTKLRPYVCDLCPKSFKRLQYLREHQNFHKGEKPFVCQECKKSFYDWASLYRHKKSHAKSSAKPLEENLNDERTVVLTNNGQKFEFPVSSLINNQSNLGDVYQITYLDDVHQQNIDVSTSVVGDVTMETNTNIGGQLLTEVRNIGVSTATVSDVIDLGDVNESTIAVANITEPVQIQTSAVEADFSAINLLAHATTQRIYQDD